MDGRDFNARDATHICDLFAPDLVYDYRGFPERDYATLCGLLRRSLVRSGEDLHLCARYQGDHRVGRHGVIARVVWTLKVASAGSKTEESREPGLDVFRRQPDGSWKIARYIAYEAP